ncbi:MAG: DUF2878 family protein [Deltaproteobacteria bacterium]|nr:DUF2878 family protein [Deltaproteobacteria bacterium]
MSLGLQAVIWAVLGCGLGTALDALHAYNGVLSYPHVAFGLQDWWVPPEFALAGVAMGLGHRFIAVRLGGRPVPSAAPVEVLVGAAVFVAVYAASGWVQDTALAYGVACVVAFMGLAWWTPRDARPALLWHALGAAVMGPVVEATLSGLGLFRYHRPDVLGVPAWLPAIYLHAAVATAALDRWFNRSGGVRA